MNHLVNCEAAELTKMNKFVSRSELTRLQTLDRELRYRTHLVNT